MNKIFCIVGKAGSGCNTIVNKAMKNKSLYKIQPYTTDLTEDPSQYTILITSTTLGKVLRQLEEGKRLIR